MTLRKNTAWLVPLTGLLLVACFPVSPLTFLVFVAWVPLLLLSQNAGAARYFFLCWLNMLIWNAGTTWWIWNSTGPGAVGAILTNSLLMCFPLMLFRFAQKQAGMLVGSFTLVACWVAWEYLHHNWELSWPWLTLGNIFAEQPIWIQWYEFTGTTGGTLWIWLTNLVAYQLIVNVMNEKAYRSGLAVFLLTVGLPIAAGRYMYQRLQTEAPSSQTYGVVVVQPNVEPYEEKFNTPPEQLVERLIALSEKNLDSTTRLVVWPETAIPAQAWEHMLAENQVFEPVFRFVKRHPAIMLVTGIDSYKLWGSQHPGGFSIRQMNDGTHYEAFNTAMMIESNLEPQLYHKSKLVPGVETLPSWLGFMSSLFDDFGGISGSLGRNDSAAVFSSPANPFIAAPIICYESIYSDYTADYVRKGANVLTIITNDGWWGNTPGYRQHMAMARLRAIESRRWVARSANTGISCFITPAGLEVKAQPWNVASAITQPVEPRTELTFYSMHGDWLSRIIWPFSILLLLYSVYRWNISSGKQPKPR